MTRGACPLEYTIALDPISESSTLWSMETIRVTPATPMLARRVPGARIAAVGDLHFRNQENQRFSQGLGDISLHADLLLVAGDLTDNGRLAEAEAAGEYLATARVPVIAVLGNHDLRSLRRVAFRRALERWGVEVLDGRATRLMLPNGATVGIAGTPGCGGGFWPLEGPNAIHARTLKRLAVRTKRESLALDTALRCSVEADIVIALTHFAPTVSTLGREPLAKYWMLGNCDLGRVLDNRHPDLVIHGHAHLGTLHGSTPGGLPVRNVAWSVAGGVYFEAVGAVTAPASQPVAARLQQQWI